MGTICYLAFSLEEGSLIPFGHFGLLFLLKIIVIIFFKVFLLLLLWIIVLKPLFNLLQ